MFTQAIVRTPSDNFADGLTSVDLGAPDLQTALKQHKAYCEALVRCGLSVMQLEPDPAYPDSTFVEDTAILTENSAVITRPGAASREGEIKCIAKTLSKYYDKLDRIEPPGTIDGGDVCRIENHFLIGVSDRTNEEGAWQLSKYLHAAGFTTNTVDIRRKDGLLHLKSGVSYLGEGRVLATEALAAEKAFKGFEVVEVPKEEEYAANCIRVNDHLLIAAGFPKLRKELKALRYNTVGLEMSEFQKMDGGLSCLSLRL
jgi:dimethylargininase